MQAAGVDHIVKSPRSNTNIHKYIFIPPQFYPADVVEIFKGGRGTGLGSGVILGQSFIRHQTSSVSMSR